MKADLHVNRAFRPFRRLENRSFPIRTTVEPVAELAAARFRARGGYTDPAPSPQASNDRFTNYLNEPESRKDSPTPLLTSDCFHRTAAPLADRAPR